jgi:DNA polymerase elongation subunit (family B)
MEHYNLLSRAVKNRWTFGQWLRDRLEAKANGDKELADQLKLKINSVYGNMKNPNSPLYDPSYGSSIAVLGQKVMTILVMGLQSKGCDIVNVNTDGVMFTGPEDLSDIYQFVNKWESAFGLKLTEEAYVEFEQADVNNYKAKDSHGNVIVKGKKFKDVA